MYLFIILELASPSSVKRNSASKMQQPFRFALNASYRGFLDATINNRVSCSIMVIQSPTAGNRDYFTLLSILKYSPHNYLEDRNSESIEPSSDLWSVQRLIWRRETRNASELASKNTKRDIWTSKLRRQQSDRKLEGLYGPPAAFCIKDHHLATLRNHLKTLERSRVTFNRRFKPPYQFRETTGQDTAFASFQLQRQLKWSEMPIILATGKLDRYRDFEETITTR